MNSALAKGEEEVVKAEIRSFRKLGREVEERVGEEEEGEREGRKKGEEEGRRTRRGRRVRSFIYLF